MAAESVTLEIVLSEVRNVKSQLCILPKILDDIEFIKKDIVNLKTSLDCNSLKLKNLDTKVKVIENRVLTIRRSQIAYSDDVDLLNKYNVNREQWSRFNNVEIKGVSL